MANESLDDLLAALETAASGLPGVTKKRMFGCDGLFANANIFGLIWKEGRIGIRLPNEIAYAEAMKMPGSSPWKAGTMTMSHWVLVPEALHADASRLSAWVRRAHALAVNASGSGKAVKPAEKAKPAPAKVTKLAKPAVKKAPAPAAKRATMTKRAAKTSAKPAAKARPKTSAAKKRRK